MPQSPVVDNYIQRKMSSRLFRDLESMSNKLNTNKNKLLSEANDNDYDILIDDDIFKEEGND